MTLTPSPDLLPLLKTTALSWLGTLTLLTVIVVAKYIWERPALTRVVCALGVASLVGFVFLPQVIGPCCWDCWGWFFCRAI